MKQRYYILLLLLFPFLKTNSQEQDKDVSINAQMWLDYNVHYDIEDNKTLSGFVSYRSITPHIFNNFLVVSTYNINNLKSFKFLKLKKPFINSFHLGARMNYIDNKYEEDDFEFRLMEGIKFFLPSIKVSF